MLHFRKMILKNFGPYKGEQTIDFTNEPGVTIFWGNNGRGKTTLLNAFRFALFGVVQRRNGPLKNMREMENTEAAEEGSYGYAVILEMTNNDDYYRLTRKLALRPGIVTPQNDEDYEKTLFLSKNGDVLSPDDRDHELNMIMPEQVSRFFLFDAELLQEYEELLAVDTVDGTQIKMAIEKILGVPVLQNGVVDLEECVTRYEKQMTKAARADKKTNQLGVELESVNANIEQHKINIHEQEAKLSELIKQKNQTESRLKDTQQISNWITKRNELERAQKEAEEELSEIEEQLGSLLKDAWKGLLLTTLRDFQENITSEIEVLNSKKQKHAVANHFIKEMKKAVENRKCPICDQEVSGDVLAHLESEIASSTSEYYGLTEEESEHLYDLNDSQSVLKSLSEDVVDLKPEIENHEKQIEKLKVKISQYRSEISEIKDDISRYNGEFGEDDILGLNRKYSIIDRNITDIREGLAEEKKKLQKNKEDKEKLANAIDKQARGVDYRLASRRKEACEHLYNIFAESKISYREQLKQNVEKDATTLFVQLTSDQDYVGLKINENYGLEIIHKSGQIVPGRSSGYEHIVALSLIGALHKNAPLRGPIIMDSPFGRMDEVNSANIIHALPEMAEQTILLVYNGEIDPQIARKQLGSHLLHEYKLERISSMHTEIEGGNSNG